MNAEQMDFSEVDERIRFLDRKIYEINEFGRTDNNALDFTRTIELRSYRNEREQLVYLRNLADKVAQPTEIRWWQAILLAIYSTIAMLIAVLSLWMASAQ